MVRCPICLRENPENALYCRKCGSYLLEGNGKETDLLSVGEVNWMNREETSGSPRVDVTFSPGLKLTILDSGHDVEVPLTKEVNIGRLDLTSDSFPDVDLSSDNAMEKGVSRRHAKITRRGSEVFIEDLGSMNGTFLNYRKLIPYLPQILRDGDELRIGELMLRVSFIEQGHQRCA